VEIFSHADIPNMPCDLALHPELQCVEFESFRESIDLVHHDKDSMALFLNHLKDFGHDRCLKVRCITHIDNNGSRVDLREHCLEQLFAVEALHMRR